MTHSARRLPPAPTHRIDRTRVISFSFDGRTYQAYPGDTIASALTAAGVRTLSRSFKYHRRRGLLCVSGDCPNCLVQVGDEPNVRSCLRLVTKGMSVRSQNAWPSLQIDVMSLTQLVGRFLPAGFYYKAFMRPRALWPLYEDFLRQAAGLGKLDPGSQRPAAYRQHEHADVAVIGGGPAGMSAALAAAELGARVALLDERSQLGGHLLYRRGPEAGDSALARARALRHAVASQPLIRVFRETTAVGWYEGNWLAAERDSSLIKLRTRSMVVATGAIDIPLTFENSDLPGIMLGSGVQRLMRGWGVVPGARAVVVSANPHGPLVALDLLEADVEVAALVDLADPVTSEDLSEPMGRDMLSRLRGAGVRILSGHQVTRAFGRREIESIELLPANGGIPERIKCDLLVASSGLAPVNQLLHLAGAELQWDTEGHQFVPVDHPEGVFSAGGAAGNHDTELVEQAGKRVGIQAAKAAGFGAASSHDRNAELEVQMDKSSRHGQVWSVPTSAIEANPSHGRDDQPKSFTDKHEFVCLCEDVTVQDVQLSLDEGYDSEELLKRYSTVSMGPCQGKMCNSAVMHHFARLKGQAVDEVAATTARPPVRPVKMSSYAGRILEPERLTPLHDWHVNHGAKLMVAGPWLRPEHYGDPVAEVRAVRERVGLIDVSTLGKFHLHGNQVPQLLELLYTNRWRKLDTGRVRYGVMVNEEGVVMDDGVTARLADDFYYMTTTSSGAVSVYEWIEWWLQSSHPLAVHVTNTTELRAAMNLAGPLARQVLSKVIEDVDLNSDSFPYLHARQGRVAGAPALLFRIGFTGELGYEIHVPSGFGFEVWEALMDAGEEHGIRPFGVEAQRVLRLEKGHLIVGQDTDGLSNPIEAGLGWAVKLEKSDFLGKPSLVRIDERAMRQRLVGFEMLDRQPPQEANQIVEPGSGPLGLKIIGRVTSARYSSVLGRSIGLAWLPLGSSDPGSEFTIRVEGNLRRARVVQTPFYDPEGSRLRA